MPNGQEARAGEVANAMLDTPGTAEAVASRYHAVFERGYALVVYNDNDCAEDTTLRRPDGSWAFRTTRFFPAYPGYDWGILAAWAWGASRVADCRLTDHRFACVGIGSETSGGVKGVRIERCVCHSGREAIYIKSRIGRAGGDEDISGEDLDVTAPTFLRVNLTEGGNSSTADEPVGGLAGYPYARNLAFSRIKVDVKTLVRADEISALRPIRNFSLTDVTGHCTEGLRLANMSGVVLSNLNLDGLKGPLLSIAQVTGTGMEGAVTIPAPVDPPPGNARGRQETGSSEAPTSAP